MDCDHFIAGAALIGGISYFHTYAYDLLAAERAHHRLVVRRGDRGARRRAAAQEGHLHVVVDGVRVDRPLAVARRATSGSSRRRCRPTASRSSPSSTSRARPGTSTTSPYTILRPFNCVGIGESRALGDVEIDSGNVKLAMSHVVPDLVQKVLKGQDPLHILGEGDQVRHYTYGGDLARGIVLTPRPPRRAATTTSTCRPRSVTPSSSSPRSSGARSRARTCRCDSCTTRRSSTTCRGASPT